MTNQEVLDKIDVAVDFDLLIVDFPNISRVISKLDDGTQEVIFRMQGADPEFHPGADLAAIGAVKMSEISNPVKNTITWRKHKLQARQVRNRRFLNAILKRIRALIQPAGVTMKQLHSLIGENLPTEGGEL